MSSYMNEIKVPDLKKLKEMQQRFQHKSVLDDSFTKQGVSMSARELKTNSLSKSTNVKNVRQRDIYKSPRQIRNYQNQSFSSARQELDDSLEKELLRQSMPEQESKRVLNLQARFMIANKKAKSLERKLTEKQKETQQLEREVKKQNSEIQQKTKEYETKLQRSKEQIYKYQCENEKLVAQIQSTGRYQDQLTRVSIRAEESNKNICDLRKTNKQLEEQNDYLKFQNQELTRQLTEAQNRFDLLAQTSADFMRRTKEIVGNNQELQHLLMSCMELDK